MKAESSFAKTVKLCAISGCALCAVFAFWNHLFPSAALLALAITAGTTGYHFVMRLAVGWIVPAVFRGKLNPKSFWFRGFPFEKKLYRWLRVRKWKGKMPTYNPREFSFTDNSPAQIIRNSCCAELVHEVIILLSFLPLLASIPWGVFGVFLSTSLIAAGVDCCFVIMQRYNRPRLQQYLDRQHPISPKN